jgi:hypothetical protein
LRDWAEYVIIGINSQGRLKAKKKGKLSVKIKKHDGLTLLDSMAAHIGCTYVSDLKFINNEQRTSLLNKLEATEAETVSLWEWNDALAYLSDGREEATQEAARSLLIAAVRPQAE